MKILLWALPFHSQLRESAVVAGEVIAGAVAEVEAQMWTPATQWTRF